MCIVVIFALAISSSLVAAEKTKEKIHGKSVLPSLMAKRADTKLCADCGI